jgi:uncharacterized membrane protein YccC
MAPALLFGLRLWGAVSLALYVAFWLELDNAVWAGTTAAIVCQPSLGASLRKGWFRLIGTVVGAAMIVALSAYFPQQRLGFFLSLALWGAACGLVATLLRNFAAYSAALAGYTAVIIASDELGAVGGTNGDVFMLAVTRASEISIGIVCAGVVLASTDFGGARRRLARQLAAISAELTRKFSDSLLLVGPAQAQTRPIRRDLLRRVIALDPVIDEALGESSELRNRSPILWGAVNGLFAALSSWQMAALHLELMPSEPGQSEAEAVRGNLPQEPPLALRRGEADHVRQTFAAAARRLIALPARAPSARLLADQAAEVLDGVSRMLEGLVLLVDGGARRGRRHPAPGLRVPDWLPALVNALRVFLAIGLIVLFWILSAWPSGGLAMTFTAIIVILFAPRADQAYAIAMMFMVGSILTVALAGVVKFAILPGFSTFASFSLALGLVLVPAGVLLARSWQTGVVTGVTVSFVPLLSPANQMTYDLQGFFNTALAIVVGIGVGAMSFRLLPPLPPAMRARRLLMLSLRDLRRLAAGRVRWRSEDWKTLNYSRLAVLPVEAQPLQRAQLLAALSLGSEILRLRRVARRFDLETELNPAFAAVARGDSALAREHLAVLDHRLAMSSPTGPGAAIRLRGRGRILAISELLGQHSEYFDLRAAR